MVCGNLLKSFLPTAEIFLITPQKLYEIFGKSVSEASLLHEKAKVNFRFSFFHTHFPEVFAGSLAFHNIVQSTLCAFQQRSDITQK